MADVDLHVGDEAASELLQQAATRIRRSEPCNAAAGPGGCMNLARIFSPCWIDDRSEPGLLRADTSQHVRRLFCVPFVVVGCLVVVGLAYALYMGAPLFRLAMPLAIGILFCLLPGCIALCTSGFVVDGRMRTLTSWSSFFGFRSESRYRFDELQWLVAVRYWNRSRHGRRRLYKITVERRLTGTAPIKLADHLPGAWAAHRLMRHLAEAMQLPVGWRDETRRHASFGGASVAPAQA